MGRTGYVRGNFIAKSLHLLWMLYQLIHCGGEGSSRCVTAELSGLSVTHESYRAFSPASQHDQLRVPS